MSAAPTPNLGAQMELDQMIDELDLSGLTLARTRTLVPTFPLLLLPVEIRLRVYGAHFEDTWARVRCGQGDCALCRPSHSNPDPEPGNGSSSWPVRSAFALCQTSKQIHVESHPVYLVTTTFDFEVLETHLGDYFLDGASLSRFAQLRRFCGPPRLLHHLGLVDLPWFDPADQEKRWQSRVERVVCNMVIGLFDLEDAVKDPKCIEARYLRSVKSCMNNTPSNVEFDLWIAVDDMDSSDLCFDVFGGNRRSLVKISTGGVFIREQPRTLAGWKNLEDVFHLLNLQIKAPQRRGDRAIPAAANNATSPAA